MHTVLIYSGGLDSTTLLYDLRAAGVDIHALSVNYGQRHQHELHVAAAQCEALHVPWHCVDLTSLTPLLRGSSQTDPAVAVPHGHYTDASMRVTVVPNRNMLLLSLAAAWAISLKAEAVAYAAHAGDHAIYPDCRAVFVQRMAAALAVCDDHPVALRTPYLRSTKADIVRRGATLGVPFRETWSCYDPQEAEDVVRHCGRCATCCERAEAFALAGVEDPTDYVDSRYWKTVIEQEGSHA